MATIPKNRKYTHSFRNKTEKKNAKLPFAYLKTKNNSPMLCPLSIMGQKNRLTHNNPMLTYDSNRYDSIQVNSSGQSTEIASYKQVQKESAFGTYAIHFLKYGTISAKFIDSVRLNVARRLKKTTRFWIRLCADTPVTARSAETRMGRGKGGVAFWQSKVKPGQIFIQFAATNSTMVELIFNDLKKKSSVPIELVAQ